MRILVVNAGSSTLKLRLLNDADDVESATDVEAGDLDALERFVSGSDTIDAVGHRVVHGGERLIEPVLVDDGVRAELRSLVPLAPLHQPAALAGIDATAAVLPGVPAVACFDTAFHATMPPEATTYPLPRDWRTRFGIRRYGFHGLSHAYAARRAVELVPSHSARRLVICHLGAGSSITAVLDRRSVDTTMGFTPNEGVPMATRSGSVDVGMLAWLLDAGLTPSELSEGLQHRSGLAGLTGTGDMRAVVTAADGGDAAARLALDVWLHRLCAAIAAMAASAGGVDVLVFTGAIGENASGLRGAAAQRLAWLGVELDADANAMRTADRDVSSSSARVRTLVVHAREDIEVARGVRRVLKGRAGPRATTRPP